MTEPRFRSLALGSDHDTSDFDSGTPGLDRWLDGAAMHAQRMRTGRTFVWTDAAGSVVAYFTLAAHVVARSELPERVGHGSPDRIPAILLARLALDRSLQGSGLGEQLLVDALSRAVAAADAAGARIVVVDAIDGRAATFYEHFGFRPLPGAPMRLARKVSDVARALGSG